MERIKAFVENDPFLRPLVGIIAILLMMTVNIWGPVLEWAIRQRDRYRDWRGDAEC